jgi:hypothetical protein
MADVASYHSLGLRFQDEPVTLLALHHRTRGLVIGPTKTTEQTVTADEVLLVRALQICDALVQ